MGPYQFDRDTEVEETAPGRFVGALHERWTIGAVPNGGYVMALMLQAARAVSAHVDPFSTTAHFLSPTASGPVEVTTEVVKPGRSTTVIATSLAQADRERVRMLTILGDMEARSGPTHRFLEPPTLAGPFEKQRSLLMQNFPTNFDFQVPAEVAGGVLGHPTGRPEMGGTIAFVDGRPPDLAALMVMADGFAPVAFNLGHSAWTPTLELTIHFWCHPAPGPITVWLHSAVVEQGYHDESGDLWDCHGVLVARSRQLALIL